MLCLLSESSSRCRAIPDVIPGAIRVSSTTLLPVAPPPWSSAGSSPPGRAHRGDQTRRDQVAVGIRRGEGTATLCPLLPQRTTHLAGHTFPLREHGVNVEPPPALLEACALHACALRVSHCAGSTRLLCARRCEEGRVNFIFFFCEKYLPVPPFAGKHFTTLKERKSPAGSSGREDRRQQQQTAPSVRHGSAGHVVL